MKIDLGVGGRSLLQRALDHAEEWSNRYQWQVAVAEMALGAAVVVWAVQSGGVELGEQIVGSSMEYVNLGGALGGSAGMSVGAFAGLTLGSIGVAAMGTAIAVPAMLLSGGAAAVFGAVGYTVGDILYNFLHASDLQRFASNASFLALGVALLLHGARRFVTDDSVIKAGSFVKDGVLHLCTLATTVVAKSVADLKAFAAETFVPPQLSIDAVGTTTTATAGLAAGLVVGSSLAAGSVTVLGSSALGSIALSLGLISAPIWPVVAAGVIGLGSGYAVWKLARALAPGSSKERASRPSTDS